MAFANVLGAHDATQDIPKAIVFNCDGWREVPAWRNVPHPPTVEIVHRLGFKTEFGRALADSVRVREARKKSRSLENGPYLNSL